MSMSSTGSNSTNNLRIIILGYIVRGPLGGMTWHHLQYILGLMSLGHDVYFIEDSGDYDWCCYDPIQNINTIDPTNGLRYAKAVFEKIGFNERWAYYDRHTTQWFGLEANKIVDICASADLLLNVSAVNPIHPWFEQIAVRVFIDTDPVFTQIKHLTDSEAKRLAHQHNSFFSFGENLVKSRTLCDDGLNWRKTRQPIVLERWQPTVPDFQANFTTVMQWDSYLPREYAGHRFGMKSDSFVDYIDLPLKVGRIFDLAITGPKTPLALLQSKGWMISDPLEIARTPWAYQDFIQQSKAEFSVAKQGYVIGRSGWFSERSAAYLATGRPTLIQETGFSDWLPSGSGVIPFSTFEEAVSGVEEINRRYEFHCAAAREIAEEYFDARKVLTMLIEQAMNFR